MLLSYGIPSGKLGQGIADTIKRVSEIKGEMLMVFGSLDPHIPDSDRQILIKALENAGIPHEVFLYESPEHRRQDLTHSSREIAHISRYADRVRFSPKP